MGGSRSVVTAIPGSLKPTLEVLRPRLGILRLRRGDIGHMVHWKRDYTMMPRSLVAPTRGAGGYNDYVCLRCLVGVRLLWWTSTGIQRFRAGLLHFGSYVFIFRLYTPHQPNRLVITPHQHIRRILIYRIPTLSLGSQKNDRAKIWQKHQATLWHFWQLLW